MYTIYTQYTQNIYTIYTMQYRNYHLSHLKLLHHLLRYFKISFLLYEINCVPCPQKNLLIVSQVLQGAVTVVCCQLANECEV